MLLPEPDEVSIEAWLAGELVPEEAERVESHFEQRPDTVDEMAVDYDASLYRGLEQEKDPEVVAMVARVKSGLACDALAPGRDSWREVLSGTDRDDILGTLGEYEVTEVIATGGMAIVLKGYAPGLKRHAALKVLSPEMAANVTARERFLREARAAARLEHENVLPVYGVYDDAIPWFAMRYVEGETLQDRIDRNEIFSVGQLKSIGLQMAAALEAAHESGIIHRDIKPANVLFNKEGERLWVCDFGIARCSEDPSLTYPGAIAGTPRFMSPEQARGEELDGRSDLFSLGAVLHYAATGRHPFIGETTTAVLRDIADKRPAALKRRGAKLSLWFRRLTESLLAKEKENRPASATEVLAVLETESADRSSEAVRRLRRNGWTALGSLGVLVLFPVLLGLSPVQDIVNRGLASRYDRAFFIEGRLGAWPGFRQAVRAAKDGDVIALPGGYPVTVDGLELPPGKGLTLVASSSGNRPVIAKAIASSPGIMVRSQFRLVGIDAVVNASDRGQPLFVAAGGSIEFEDCRLRAEVSGSGLETAVELRDGATLTVVNSDFDLPHADAVVIGGGPSRISIRNSRLWAGRIFHAPGESSVPGEIGMEIEASEFSGDLFFLSESSDSVPLLAVEAKNSRFDLDDSLCWFRTVSLAHVEERIRWNGNGNRHASGGAWVKVDDDPRRLPPRFHFSVDRLSDTFRPPPAGSVELVETGEIFSSLKEAIEAAPRSATLLLRGRLECPELVIGEIDRTVELRAAPGASPVVVSTHRDEHALFLRGATRISGIRFERSGSSGESQPILGFLSEEDEVVIEDCVFVQSFEADGNPNISTALGITGTRRAEIRRCLFQGGSALWLAFVSYRGTVESEIRVEDCVFENAFGFRFRAHVSGRDLSVRIERCVGLFDGFAEVPGDSEVEGFDIELRDSVVDVGGPSFLAGASSTAPLLDLLDWTGGGNVFRAGVPLTVSVSSPDGNVAHLLEERIRATGTFLENPFDRSQLAVPAGPATMLEALSGEVSPSAVETMRRFAESAE